ncbi:O-antigen ligase family protein [Mycetocola sp. 2940]|uniref:O-antigen ligase family protein n=1 Tax=Mycetocola sp. 2940 TaxID=3156452 RepID=UPI00339201A3
MTSPTVAPPAALSTPRLWASGVATFALFVAFAGDGIRHLLSLWGFVAVSILAGIACLVLLAVLRPTYLRRRTPKALLAFTAFALLSVAWSAYPGASLFTLTGMLLCVVAGVFLALCFDWAEVVRLLANAIKWVLALSILFELWVSVVVRDRVLPLWVDFGSEPPLLAYWSRNLLFDGGKIQGILGNSNLLGILALFGVILFAAQWAAGTVRRVSAIVWLVLAVGMFLLTRSSTMIIAAVVVAVVLAGALLVRNAPSPSRRTPVYLGGLVLLLAAAAAVSLLNRQLLALLGKSEDLTGRLDIWQTVIETAGERPWVGWGYSSPWVPWVEPFQDLVVRRGFLQLHAHNAWLDVWFQLGIVGLVLFTAVLVSTLWRSWFAAVDRPRFDLRDDRPYTVLSLVPLLLLVVLLVQSVAESRILIESGWVLVVLFCLKTKQHPTIVLDARPEASRVPEPGR